MKVLRTRGLATRGGQQILRDLHLLAGLLEHVLDLGEGRALLGGRGAVLRRDVDVQRVVQPR